MPSSKRRRAAPAAENDATPIVSDASTSQLVMLDRYHLLPPEIQRHIIDVACLAPSSAGNDAVHFNQDLPTVLNICIVSRAFKAYAIPSLYRHISITRPSSLHALQQVLQKNPGRAALIRSLHVGPAGGPLPAHWWPLTHAYRPGGGLHVDQARLTDHSCEWITTSLRKDQLPSGYEALESWPIGLRKPSGCREAAIHEALVTACASLDVDLERPGLGHYWSYDAGKAWIPRVFEVQAALDLYLLKLRSLENEDPALVRLAQPGARIPAPCRTGSCSHYPALVITGLPPPRHGWRSFPLGAFMVHRGEILRHLARSGAITDRFDHPITLARSGFDVSVFRPSWERVEPDVRYELRSESWDLEGVHEQYDFADLATLRESDRLVAGWTSPDRPFAGPLSTATLGSTLQLARSVLAFLTNLNNLSLTGYLEAALARSALASSSLRRLTLGPCPPSWLAATANVQELSGLVELRICGAMLDPSAIELITTEMGHLRLFEWSIAELYDSRSEERREGQPSLIDTVHGLFNGGASKGYATGGAALPECPQQQPVNSEREGASWPPVFVAHGFSSVPLIKVRLNDVDAHRVLTTAPSVEARTAWLNGIHLPNSPRRLHLVVKESMGWLVAPPMQDSSSEIWAKLHDEGRRWWRGEADE